MLWLPWYCIFPAIFLCNWFKKNYYFCRCYTWEFLQFPVVECTNFEPTILSYWDDFWLSFLLWYLSVDLQCMNWVYRQGNLTRNVQELLERLSTIYFLRLWSIEYIISLDWKDKWLFGIDHPGYNYRSLVSFIPMETLLCMIPWFEWHR